MNTTPPTAIAKKKKRYNRAPRDTTRINERIRAPRVRVVLPDGRQLGIMTPMEALAKAKLVGLDLVEIAEKADPPVCRIIDYGKYKYEQAKLQKQQKTSKNATRMKEIKFRVRTEQHDYNIKLGRIESFLDEGHKVRVVLQYRGRENAHKELGFDKLNRIIGDLKTMANVDQEPRLSGRAVGMLLSPLPKAQRQRKFHLYHGELIDEDEFAAEEEEDDEEVDFDSDADEAQADGEEDRAEA
ncbi:translation initiation factor IF-3 [Haloferula chungangensis]|uniref:Translation initiation factor IF-3 n=1 Tax=Haloferula chungangensis TaxID=1048331 RepID=A0ABW2L4B6_9BACT